MSHRALVAIELAGGRYDVRSSHDGGEDDRLEQVLPAGAAPPPDLVDGPPVATGVTFAELLADHLDPIEHEALLVIGQDGGVDPFVVLPYVLATAQGLVEWDQRGVAVGLASRSGGPLDPAFVRGWYQGVAGVLAEAIDVGLLSRGQAFDCLDDCVRRFAGDEHAVVAVP